MLGFRFCMLQCLQFQCVNMYAGIHSERATSFPARICYIASCACEACKGHHTSGLFCMCNCSSLGSSSDYFAMRYYRRTQAPTKRSRSERTSFLASTHVRPSIAIKDTVVFDQYFGLGRSSRNQGRNVDQILPYFLLQLKVERGWRLRKMYSKTLRWSFHVLKK